jgi:manganese/zinc/iron transport system permease protein
MTWYSLDTWSVVIGVLTAIACALPGAILVLRQMSMMGDAISHTVLPGLAIAFLLTNSRDPLPMLAGAMVVGVFTAALVQWIQHLGRLDAGTSMGVVFTILFAIGLVLIRRAIDHVDLDADCVLYGDLLTVADVDTSFGVPSAAITCGAMALINLGLIVVFYKEFKISAFDAALADTLGIRSQTMHYLLMTMTAVTTVAAFQIVGSILVIALLIVPAATAYLLTDRFGIMIFLAAIIGSIAAALGHVAAITVPGWFGLDSTVTSGSIAVMTGLLFGLAWMFSPRHGLVAKAYIRLQTTLRIIREDILGMLYRLEELRGEPSSMNEQEVRTAVGAKELLAMLALRRLMGLGQLVTGQGGVLLTDSGRREARGLVRSHRLWESYLHRHLNLPTDQLHRPAHVLEHVTDPHMRERLADRTDQVDVDPHAKPIPPEPEGEKLDGP